MNLWKKSSSNETKLNLKVKTESLSLTWACANSASSGWRCYYFVFTLRDMVINKYFHQFLILILIIHGHAMVDWTLSVKREVLFRKTQCVFPPEMHQKTVELEEFGYLPILDLFQLN